MENLQKTCTKCGLSKSLDEFYAQKGGLYGKASRCKTCEKAYKALRAILPKIVLQEKVCTKCGMTKVIDEFDKQASSPDGKGYNCKACVKSYNAERVNHLKIVVEEKRCSKCGIVRPIQEFNNSKASKDRHSAHCKQCQKAINEANKESRQAAYFADQEAKKQYAREYYEAHKPKANDDSAAWYQANKDKASLDNSEWRKAHPESRRESHSRRRANKAGALRNDLTDTQWQEIQAAFQWRCVYCPADCKKCKKQIHVLTQDHVTPYFNNGSNTVWNVVPACGPCNSRKGTKPPPIPIQPLLLTIAPSRSPQKKASN